MASERGSAAAGWRCAVLREGVVKETRGVLFNAPLALTAYVDMQTSTASVAASPPPKRQRKDADLEAGASAAVPAPATPAPSPSPAAVDALPYYRFVSSGWTDERSAGSWPSWRAKRPASGTISKQELMREPHALTEANIKYHLETPSKNPSLVIATAQS